MPSKESEELKRSFKTVAANFPQDDNSFLELAVYDQMVKAGKEATGVSFEDAAVQTRTGPIPCKWIRPERISTSDHVMLFMHGGGFSFGSPESHRKLAAHLAKSSGCSAISVDYRRAPRYKYPAALDDCVAVYQYLIDRGYSANKVVVAGDSVGGGLATCVPLACIKRGLPVPGLSIALSPCYDHSTQSGGTFDSNEANDVLNTKDFCKKLADRYVDGSGADYKDPLISPLYARPEDLRQCPPHWISAAGHDQLRDHSERMAENLKTQGVDVTLEVHEGQQHVMEFAVGNSPEATESIQRIGAWVQEKMRT